MVNTFTPRNPLAAAMSADGIDRNAAAAEAHTNLEQLRADSMAELAPSVSEVDDAAVPELYAAANRVVAIAGVFALHDMSGHAYELCEAISRMQDAGAWKSAVVLGFVDSLHGARSA